MRDRARALNPAEPNTPRLSSSAETYVDSRRPNLSPGAVLVWLVFSFITLTIGIMALPRAGSHYDFREFYAAGYLLLHQPSQLFNLSAQQAVQNALVSPMQGRVPFYHPAYEALFFAPFTALSYRPAYIAFAVFNLLLLLVCYRLAPVAHAPQIAKIPRAFLFFLCFPAFMAIVQGQDSILFFLLLCLLWRALVSHRDRAAGILLALALFKLQIALPLLFFLAAYLPKPRRARLLFSFVPAAAAVALLCLLITGWHGTVAWLHLIALSSIVSQQGAHAQAAITVYSRAMPTINGLLYVCGAHLLPARAFFAIDILLSAVVFAATLYLVRKTRSTAVAFCAALAATLLLAPHLFLYDYVLLLLPVLLLTYRRQTLFAALYYLLNYVLFVVGGIDWFALMALVPLVLLSQILSAELRPEPAPLPNPSTSPDPEAVRVS